MRDEVTVLGTRRARRITTSVGVAPFASAEATGEELLVERRPGDVRGQGGRPQPRTSVYAADRHEPQRAQARMHWVERIREALLEDRFVLHAQPILDLRTGVVAQYELLVRMLDDDGELIPPGAFLQAAERFGLIQDIDRWVVARARSS